MAYSNYQDDWYYRERLDRERYERERAWHFERDRMMREPPRFLPAIPAKQATQVPATKEQALQLFEYAVIYVPQDDKGKPDKKNSKVLVGPSTTLATSGESVRTSALREFKDEDGLDLDAVKVLVRPFENRV